MTVLLVRLQYFYSRLLGSKLKVANATGCTSLQSLAAANIRQIRSHDVGLSCADKICEICLCPKSQLICASLAKSVFSLSLCASAA